MWADEGFCGRQGQCRGLGLEIKSGKLSSGYGEGIDLVLQWSAVPNGEDYEITFELSLDCYSLFVGARKDGALIVDGRKFTVVNDALEFPENERRQIPLGSYTVNLQCSRWQNMIKKEAAR